MFCSKKNNEENYKYSFFEKPEIILNTTNLSDNQKILFRRRIMKKLYHIRKIKNIYSFLFYLYKFLSSSLGVIIPALLSIQYYYQGEDSLNNPIYWNAWGLSLAGAFVNGYANIFKVDQRFTLLKMIYQKLKFEIWCFLILCNHYDIKNNNNKKLTHQDVFQNFFETFENTIDNFKNTEIDTLTKKEEKNDQISPRETVLNDISYEIETPRKRIFNEIDVNLLSPESQELYHKFVNVMSQHLN